MKLFDNNNDILVDYECNCRSCSLTANTEIVDDFLEEILNSNSVDELRQVLFDFVGTVKVQSFKEFLHEELEGTINALSTLGGLEVEDTQKDSNFNYKDWLEDLFK